MAPENEVTCGALANQLSVLAEESTFDEKEFWPHGCIIPIITKTNVSQGLGTETTHLSVEARRAENKKLDKTVHYILANSKTVFSILLCCSLNSQEIRQAMDEFKVLGFDDSKLPVLFHDKKSPPPMFYSSENRAYRGPWTVFRVRYFDEYQWRFAAPVFRKGAYDLPLHKNTILPFTGATKLGGSGTFGEVHDVNIHCAHRKADFHVRLTSYLFSRNTNTVSLSANKVISIVTESLSKS